MTLTDGNTLREGYRLLTTLLDPDLDPAKTLIRLYHERWEIESAYYALRHTLMHGRVLRSGDPFGLDQEMWALLTLYQLLRTAMVDAVETKPGTDPDRASFTVALETARDQLIRASNTDTGSDLVGAIGTAVLAHLLPAREPGSAPARSRAHCPATPTQTPRRQDLRPTPASSPSTSASTSITDHTSVRLPSPSTAEDRAHTDTPVVLDRPRYAALRSHPGRYWGVARNSRTPSARRTWAASVFYWRSGPGTDCSPNRSEGSTPSSTIRPVLRHQGQHHAARPFHRASPASRPPWPS
ncbi:hypothetical protein [Streptomyces sp. UG1]|uniref:hypothetical protein n=1 Tax=Streptomyces sp. UG1 TaxID=3417652 RepID=UPI003CF23D66